jgi:hypothetical protein
VPAFAPAPSSRLKPAASNNRFIVRSLGWPF